MQRERPQRRSIRLKGYDYTQPGGYYVTICTFRKRCVLGQVVGEEVRLDPPGRIVEECWRAIPDHFPRVVLDEFVVMPNHLHGILILSNEDGTNVPRDIVAHRDTALPHPGPQVGITSGSAEADPDSGTLWRPPTADPRREAFGRPVRGSVPTIVRSLKSAVTKRVNKLQQRQGTAFWQDNYHEHVVRDRDDLDRIREYIILNPLRWADDDYHPRNVRG